MNYDTPSPSLCKVAKNLMVMLTVSYELRGSCCKVDII